jgi:hypothetical protein
MWTTEMVLDAISVPYVTIPAQMGEVAAEFTDTRYLLPHPAHVIPMWGPWPQPHTRSVAA